MSLMDSVELGQASPGWRRDSQRETVWERVQRTRTPLLAGVVLALVALALWSTSSPNKAVVYLGQEKVVVLYGKHSRSRQAGAGHRPTGAASHALDDSRYHSLSLQNDKHSGLKELTVVSWLAAYHQTELADANAEFFVRHALNDAADFVFIVNGKSDFKFPTHLPNVQVIQRGNTCYDLGKSLHATLPLRRRTLTLLATDRCARRGA